MNEDRNLLIHFNNGEKLQVTFPAQAKSSVGAMMEGVKRALESDKLVIEADGRVIIIPWCSIRQVELTPVVAGTLPFGAVKNATIVQSL